MTDVGRYVQVTVYEPAGNLTPSTRPIRTTGFTVARPVLISRTSARQPTENDWLRTSVAGREAVTVSVSSPQGVMSNRVAVPTAGVSGAPVDTDIVVAATNETGALVAAVRKTAMLWR